jgi:hypothetical protein
MKEVDVAELGIYPHEASRMLTFSFYHGKPLCK